MRASRKRGSSVMLINPGPAISVRAMKGAPCSVFVSRAFTIASAAALGGIFNIFVSFIAELHWKWPKDSLVLTATSSGISSFGRSGKAFAMALWKELLRRSKGVFILSVELYWELSFADAVGNVVLGDFVGDEVRRFVFCAGLMKDLHEVIVDVIGPVARDDRIIAPRLELGSCIDDTARVDDVVRSIQYALAHELPADFVVFQLIVG